MRIGVAEVSQETNTFSPVPCGLEYFRQMGLYTGQEVLDKKRGVGRIGGFLKGMEKWDLQVELVPILAANASAGGRVTAEALEYFRKQLVDGLKAAPPLDAFVFSLHGASSAEGEDDLEGSLLEAVRSVTGSEIPLMAIFDHHANITRRIIENTNLMIGFRTQPHFPFETGVEAAGLMYRYLKGEYNPTVGWQKIPLLVGYHERLNTTDGPMKEWFDLAREIEARPGVVTVSTFPMQPWMDILEAGMTAVVYTDNDPQLARELAVELANKAWSLRKEFVTCDRLSAAEAVKKALSMPGGPIIISDPADTVFGGAPGDSTCLLNEVISQGVTETVLIPIYDPEVYEQMVTAGEGREITTRIGGKYSGYTQNLPVTGRVGKVSQGFEFKAVDPRTNSSMTAISQGPAAILEIGSIKLLVGKSRMMAGFHPDIYRHFGIEPTEAKIIVMKTGTNFYNYDSISKGLVMADCPGVASADLKRFTWERAPRPLYPVDDFPYWEAKP